MGRLRAAAGTHAGVSVQTLTTAPLTYVGAQYQTEPHVAYGCFQEDRLVAFICCWATPEFWVLDLMVSSGEPRALQVCLEQCLQHYEALGIFQFYYAFPEKWARAYRSFWRSGAPSLRKYVIEDIERIEPNKRPINPMVWADILHEQIVKIPLLLRRSTCLTHM